jgi:hypothetical protein
MRGPATCGILSLFFAASLCSSTAAPADGKPLAMPKDFRVMSRQLRVDLAWDDTDPAMSYEIQRSAKADGNFETLPVELPGVNAYSDFIGTSGQSFFYRMRMVSMVTNQAPATSAWSEAIEGRPGALNADQLLTEVQEAGFRYFYDYGHPVSGLARVGTRKKPEVCSIGGTGWGLYNLVVGVDRGFIDRQQGVERALRILHFLTEKADRFHGAFPHWLDGSTGKVIPFSKLDDGADLVETSFLMEGVILLREYFSRDTPDEAKIRQLSDALWRGVEWNWFVRETDGHPGLYWHWSPDNGWLKNHPITGFNECQIVYILALSSPTHPIQPDCYWQGWETSRYETERTQFGIPLVLSRGIAPPLFWTEFSYMGMDPRMISYHGRTYFDHFRDFCRVQVLYGESMKDQFKGYGPLWGLSASYGPDGYKAFAPGPRDNGTITPTAAISSMPYVPDESRAFLLELYEKHGKDLWGPFGFYDAFNFTRDWVARDYLGNEVGTVAPMVENYRSGLCWKTFMKAPEIGPVLKLLAGPPPELAKRKEP